MKLIKSLTINKKGISHVFEFFLKHFYFNIFKRISQVIVYNLYLNNFSSVESNETGLTNFLMLLFIMI